MSFYTDVLMKSPLFASSLRMTRLDFLEPITRAAVEAILAESDANGQPLMVFETFRSQARQELLFSQGATQLKEVGVHLYGLAADLVKDIDGDPSWKGSFDFLAVLAKKHGLISGLNWGIPNIKHGFIDACHVQRCAVKDQPLLFDGTWYPDEKYDPYTP
jgi:hypothetical protein